ncbi:hypothetical protein PENTCL1PPCAC_10520 [Pristionchus entomophagus]|uniref:EGF-like domain-containing protein n=1 Tax=Pristionchus entomophagus TaxID=358040 RepID=A0AAV5SYD9_9BILA|nr:hypothetical protein PENTCL1PPCAC_10520 [Pristionchus entomophagus]
MATTHLRCVSQVALLQINIFIALPATVDSSHCYGTIHKGPPNFERDWCECVNQGGFMQAGVCGAFSDSCSADEEICSGSKVCQFNETAGEDFRCDCPLGSCLYPYGDCPKVALVYNNVDMTMGECATIRCTVEDLEALVPTNCRITPYDQTEISSETHSGSTDVICTHDINSQPSEKVQTRHSAECVNGKWEGVEFNKVCHAIKGYLNFDKDMYNPFEIATVFYSNFPEIHMSIQCNGNGEWMGEVPPHRCINGTLRQVFSLVRCICDDGFYGVDCSSPCDQGKKNVDGSCDCLPGFYGDQCEISEKCEEIPVEIDYNEDQIDLVFIIDLYKAGYVIQITDEETGLISGIQQLVRDISYYDGKFVRNIKLIVFGSTLSLLQKSFPWSSISEFVETLVDLESLTEDTCTMGLNDVLTEVRDELMSLPRGSIINMFSNQPSLGLDEINIDVCLGNSIIANILIDSRHYAVSGCPSASGMTSHYLRLAQLTGGYFLDGMTPSAFMQILPRLYKSSIVLIPGITEYDEYYGPLPYSFVLDEAAQSIIIYAHGGINNMYEITGNTSPKSMQLDSENDQFQVLHNGNLQFSCCIYEMNQ